MLAMIWHEIVCRFLKTYQYLKRFAAHEQRIVFVLTFRCAEQFYVPNTQKQSKTGKNPEINRQSFIIWWHNSRKYRSVRDLLSCTRGRCIKMNNFWMFSDINGHNTPVFFDVSLDVRLYPSSMHYWIKRDKYAAY